MVNSNLPSEDAVITSLQIDDACHTAAEICTEVDAMKRLCQNVKKLADAVDTDKDFLSTEANKEAAKRIVKDLYISGLSHTHFIYQAITTPNTASGLLSQENVQRENFAKYARDIEGVDAYIHGQKLYIEMPVLPVMYSRKQSPSVRSGAAKLRKHYDFFTQSLHQSLLLLDNKMPTFQEQNITYVFAFSPDEVVAVDCDNLDTKAVTDTICLHTLCDDSADKTSFSLVGIRTETVPKGTYICVAPDKFPVQNVAEIIQVFRLIHHQKTAKNGV